MMKTLTDTIDQNLEELSIAVDFDLDDEEDESERDHDHPPWCVAIQLSCKRLSLAEDGDRSATSGENEFDDICTEEEEEYDDDDSSDDVSHSIDDLLVVDGNDSSRTLKHNNLSVDGGVDDAMNKHGMNDSDDVPDLVSFCHGSFSASLQCSSRYSDGIGHKSNKASNDNNNASSTTTTTSSSSNCWAHSCLDSVSSLDTTSFRSSTTTTSQSDCDFPPPVAAAQGLHSDDIVRLLLDRATRHHRDINVKSDRDDNGNDHSFMTDCISKGNRRVKWESMEATSVEKVILSPRFKSISRSRSDSHVERRWEGSRTAMKDSAPFTPRRQSVL